MFSVAVECVGLCSELFKCACYVTCHVLVVAVQTLSQHSLRLS